MYIVQSGQYDGKFLINEDKHKIVKNRLLSTRFTAYRHLERIMELHLDLEPEELQYLESQGLTEELSDILTQVSCNIEPVSRLGRLMSAGPERDCCCPVCQPLARPGPGSAQGGGEEADSG